jgi:hypothetical protein
MIVRTGNARRGTFGLMAPRMWLALWLMAMGLVGVGALALAGTVLGAATVNGGTEVSNCKDPPPPHGGGGHVPLTRAPGVEVMVQCVVPDPERGAASPAPGNPPPGGGGAAPGGRGGASAGGALAANSAAPTAKSGPISVADIIRVLAALAALVMLGFALPLVRTEKDEYGNVDRGFTYRRHWGGFGGATTGWEISTPFVKLLASLGLVVMAALVLFAALQTTSNDTVSLDAADTGSASAAKVGESKTTEPKAVDAKSGDAKPAKATAKPADPADAASAASDAAH